MGVAETFREVLESHGSNKGDSAEIVDYIISMLEDEDFEFGPDGEEAYEAIGPFLVGRRRQRLCLHMHVRMGVGSCYPPLQPPLLLHAPNERSPAAG